MAQWDIPLPEITAEDFDRSWARFELVAKAKEWNDARQLTVIPTLLRGKLLDYFLDLSEDEKSSMGALRTALVERAGLSADPLVAAKKFMARNQGNSESVADYLAELKRSFKRAHPRESLDSTVLLQKFLTGLRSPICQQLLLKGRPDTLQAAAKSAQEIEYALDFDSQNQPAPIHVVQQKDESIRHLQEAVRDLSNKLTSLEMQLKDARQQRRRPVRCYQCGQLGHVKRQCPLNFHKPDPAVSGVWQGNQ